ncbi:MAG: putative nucleic acid-binding protein [Candidatus Latescibacterota bacterium]|jgi:predicted nucleic acid-binding protein
MANCFFDTSALIKYYHEEIGRKKVIDLINEPSNRIFISRLGLIEWHSALARLVRMGILIPNDFRILRSRFLSDIRNRKLRILPLNLIHQQRAIRLLMTYARTENLRTLDALQLAVALEFHRQAPLDYFVCADIPFCQIARQEGLFILNPEED